MQGQDTQKTNVVSLFSARKQAEEELNANAESEANADDEAEKESFKDIMERNLKNQERLAKERNSANKSVLRSYRIKH